MNSAHMEYCASPEWRQRVVEQVLPLALDGVTLGDHTIEIGPGPGFTTDVLHTMTTKLTAVELDAGLAASLTKRLAGTNVEVVIGDATKLEFPDSVFSGGASFHMLHHIPTGEAQDRAFTELARVMVTGGVLVAADGIYNEGSKAFHEDDIYNPIDTEDLPHRLRSAGFTDVVVRGHELGWVCTARVA